MSLISISNTWFLTTKCCESESHIATILCSNNGCTRKPGHMKNLKSPLLCNVSMVALLFNTTWSFSSCSHSFHSNIFLSCQKSHKFLVKIFAKNHTFRYQRDFPLETEHYKAGLTLLTHIDDMLVTFLGRISMRPSLVELQHAYSILPTRCQRDPTMSGPC